MAREADGRGATVDDAITDAMTHLGLDPTEERDLVEIEVLEEPRGGLLGIGSHEAIVRVTRADEAGPAEAGGAQAGPTDVQRSPASTSAPDLEEQADLVADFIEDMLGFMDIDAVAEPNEHRGQMYVDIVDGPEDDLKLLIGRQGQTLDAIQELVRTVVSRRTDQRVRVVVDVEGFRKRHDDRIAEAALAAAEEVARTGQERELDPMNPYERKLAHDAVASVDGVESGSRGVEPERYVVISPLASGG